MGKNLEKAGKLITISTTVLAIAKAVVEALSKK